MVSDMGVLCRIRYQIDGLRGLLGGVESFPMSAEAPIYKSLRRPPMQLRCRLTFEPQQAAIAKLRCGGCVDRPPLAKVQCFR